MSDLAVALGPKPQAQFQSEMKSDLLGGVVVLRHTGVAYERAAARNALYSGYSGGKVPKAPGSSDVYSVLRLVKPAGNVDAGLDSRG